MSNQNPVARTSVGKVLQTTRRGRRKRKGGQPEQTVTSSTKPTPTPTPTPTPKPTPTPQQTPPPSGPPPEATVAVGGTENLRKAVSAFPNAPALDSFVREALGGQYALLGQLLTKGCQGDSNRLKRFGEAFADGGSRRQLGAFIKSGGLASKPEALAALLDTGCGGDAQAFKTLTQRLTNPDDPEAETPALKNLKAVVDAGLGDSPAILGEMLKSGGTVPQDGQPTEFERFCTTFGAAPTALKRLLDDAGFAATTPPPPVKPDTLAQMLAVGCQRDPARLLTLAQSGSVSAVKSLLQAGGLGQQPQALGHAYQLGCDGDPARLKTLNDSFVQAGPPGLGRMKSLLVDANFQQRPEMLGEVLGTGCAKDPTKLAALAKGFDGKMGQFKEMTNLWVADTGQAIQTLTDTRHLNGNYSEVASRFAARMNAGTVSPATRQRLLKATPNFKRKGFTNPHTLNANLERPLAFTPEELGDFDGTDTGHLLAHVCERHVPEHFAFKGAKASAVPINSVNTQMGSDWTAQRVADLLKAALTSTNGQSALASIKNGLEAWEALQQQNLDYGRYLDFASNYPDRDAWNEHDQLHQRYLAYWRWARTVARQGRNGPLTKGALWNTFNSMPRSRWKGPAPERPPVILPTQNWASVAPPPWQDAPPVPPPLPPKPSTQRVFDHGNFTFKVGVLRDNHSQKLKVSQFFPTAARSPEALTQFSKSDMELLRDAMLP